MIYLKKYSIMPWAFRVKMGYKSLSFWANSEPFSLLNWTYSTNTKLRQIIARINWESEERATHSTLDRDDLLLELLGVSGRGRLVIHRNHFLSEPELDSIAQSPCNQVWSCDWVLTTGIWIKWCAPLVARVHENLLVWTFMWSLNGPLLPAKWRAFQSFTGGWDYKMKGTWAPENLWKPASIILDFTEG